MSATGRAPRRDAFLTAFLVPVTLLQVGGVLLSVMLWREVVACCQSTGQDALALTGVVLDALALVGLIGAWFWQRWAVGLYVLVVLAAFMISAVAGAPLWLLLARLVLPAILLWQIAAQWGSFR